MDVSELPVDEVPDVRPIGIGNSLRRLISRCIFEPYIYSFCEATKPTQYCVGEKGGITQCIFGMTSLLEANDDFVALSLDVENAYNETSRKFMLDATWNCPSLCQLFDPYGNGVAAATCSGDHWRQRYDIGLKLVFHDIFRTA